MVCNFEVLLVQYYLDLLSYNTQLCTKEPKSSDKLQHHVYESKSSGMGSKTRFFLAEINNWA